MRTSSEARSCFAEALLGRGLSRCVRLWTACLLFLTLNAAEEGPSVFTGTIGNSPIVMELDLGTPGEITGRYFYRKYGKDLPLSGTLTDPGGLTLTEGLPDPGKSPRPVIRLRKRSGGEWHGTWDDSKGKALPVELVPVPAVEGDEDSTSAYHDLHIDALRSKKPRVAKDKQTQFMGHSLQWWRELDSGFTYFEITSGYPPEVLKRLNVTLRERFREELSTRLDCLENAGRMGGEYTATFTPRFMSPEILSVSVFLEYYCGDAHPDFGDVPINLRVRDAHPLALEDVLWVGKGAPVHYAENDSDFDAYSKYRRGAFAPWVRSVFLKLYPYEMNAEGRGDSCEYSDPDVWTFPTWFFTPEGIQLGPSFPRAIRACEGPDWSVLPYRIVKQHPGKLRLTLP